MKRLLFLLIFAGSVFAQSNEDCMGCHEDEDLTKLVNDSIEVSVYVDMEVLSNSLHADFDCIDCHEGVSEDHPDDGVKLLAQRPKASCANCHDDSKEEYDNSVHGQALARDEEEIACCCDCHGGHNILPSDDPQSKVYPGNMAETCGECHSKPEVQQRFGRRNLDRIAIYRNSVHGRLIEEDPESGAATCTDCHGYHTILPALNPDAQMHEYNIPASCGDCHEDATEEYEQSIHWTALKRGHHESPNCTDCHGEHEIENPYSGEEGADPLASTMVCANCHSSETMMSRFGLDYRRLDSYMKSYHGLAVYKGDENAATCTSCHETHAIRGMTDSLSSVHASNLVETCGKCHENVTPTFAAIEMHPVDQESRNPIAFIVKNFYIWMIIVVIGGMFLHNLLIMIHHVREKKKIKSGQILVNRFQPFEVYQHMLMFLSFTVLVITGFALKFPDAAWVQLLVYIGMDEALRALLHRISAVVMIVISIVQTIYFVFSRNGRRDFMAMLPNLQDFKDLIINLKYYTGLSKERPRYGRYDYGEKAEYLALIWGTAVMAASGFILWFPEFFMSFLPTWIFETSEVIHYYEAWLATLAIIIWHWFFVILHPEKYPMNITWMDGKITEDEFKHHHPLEYEQLKQKSDND